VPPLNSIVRRPVKVRALNFSDLNPLLGLYRHLNPNDLPLPEGAVVEAVWSESLANPRMRHFGAYDGDELVAACTICVVPNLTRGCQPYALIENVVTALTHRRQGFGKAVLEAALSFAWSQNCYKVMLLSGRTDEGVLSFYKAAGFNPDEKRGFVARPVA
jgi:GNAT superfamily N-acetyltransferase